uniref:Uncharacterized protein n=1 Tax=Romanomermis culicivorax TaxID=13658 RepID=A0A915ICJ1_ROMCU
MLILVISDRLEAALIFLETAQCLRPYFSGQKHMVVATITIWLAIRLENPAGSRPSASHVAEDSWAGRPS